MAKIEPPPVRTDGRTERSRWLQSARRTVEAERVGLDALSSAFAGSLGEAFAQSVDLLKTLKGRAILSGIGKSGHIARKVAATLASTGTPAVFIHAAEASHGDLGMVSPQDALIMLSNSGETSELRDLLVYSRRFAVPLVAVTAQPQSTLAKAADIVLLLPEAPEACPIGLAPTTSTMQQLALGDALAIALLEDRGFTAADFGRLHPGGRLGAQLTLVRDIMHGGDTLPLIAPDTAMSQALLVISEKGFGCVGVVDGGALVGIITDGDLRRHMSPTLLEKTAEDIMTHAPKSIEPDALASVALQMLGGRITTLFVVEDGRPVGLVHVHDLLRLGVR